MTILPAIPAAVKFDSAAFTNPAASFGRGILSDAFCPRASDQAFEMGRSAAYHAERPVGPPAYLRPFERAAFEEGVMEAMAVLNARIADAATEAKESELASAGCYCW